jgi:hypothetical protein
VGKHIQENWQCGKEKIRGTAREITPKHRGGKAVFFAISSAREHAAALGMSDRSARRILHDDLHFHPYKLAVVQEVTERDFSARRAHPMQPLLTFFLWGYLKSLVYTDRPRTLAPLRENIRQAIATIPIAMLERVHRHFGIRVNQCIANGGRHFLDIILKAV